MSSLSYSSNINEIKMEMKGRVKVDFFLHFAALYFNIIFIFFKVRYMLNL